MEMTQTDLYRRGSCELLKECKCWKMEEFKSVSKQIPIRSSPIVVLAMGTAVVSTRVVSKSADVNLSGQQ